MNTHPKVKVVPISTLTSYIISPTLRLFPEIMDYDGVKYGKWGWMEMGELDGIFKNILTHQGWRGCVAGHSNPHYKSFEPQLTGRDTKSFPWVSISLKKQDKAKFKIGPIDQCELIPEDDTQTWVGAGWGKLLLSAACEGIVTMTDNPRVSGMRWGFRWDNPSKGVPFMVKNSKVLITKD